MPTIFHIDVNSAYLSWTAIEKLKENPTLDLRTIPSIIGGDTKSRHGIVLAKSIPAKKFGIRTAEPVAAAFRKCPSLHMEPPDRELYKKRSRELMSLLHTYTPDIEQVSIDECYLDFTPIAHQFSSAPAAAREIASRIRDELGFTVNIGIAPNKLLAKMASDFEKPDRVHTLFPEEIPDKMWPLPVGDLFMVGHSSAERLNSLGIRTIGDLARTDPEFLRLHFKSHGTAMWEHANGIDRSAVDSEEHDRKGIGNSVTLPEDITRTDDARKILLKLAEQVSSRLRNAGQIAGTVTVEIKYSTFRSCSRQTQPLTPVSTADALYQCACQLFDELWNGSPVRLLGIRTSRLAPAGTPVQLSLFDLDFSAPRTAKKISDSENTQGTRRGPDGAQKNSRIPGAQSGTGAERSDSDRKEPSGQAASSDSFSHVPDGARTDPADIRHAGSTGRQQRLDEALEQIRRRYGKDAVVRGALLDPSARAPKDPS